MARGSENHIFVEMASDGLVWLCVKDNNSFLRKNKGARTKRNGAITLSAEPGNLASLNTFKYSGLANSKVIKFSVEDTNTAGKTDVKITLGCKVHARRYIFFLSVETRNGQSGKIAALPAGGQAGKGSGVRQAGRQAGRQALELWVRPVLHMQPQPQP